MTEPWKDRRCSRTHAPDKPSVDPRPDARNASSDPTESSIEPLRVRPATSRAQAPEPGDEMFFVSRGELHVVSGARGWGLWGHRLESFSASCVGFPSGTHPFPSPISPPGHPFPITLLHPFTSLAGDKVVGKIKRGGYFGEVALLYGGGSSWKANQLETRPVPRSLGFWPTVPKAVLR